MAAINLANNHCPISNQGFNIIKQATKPILFHDCYLWNNCNSLHFGIDIAKGCELINILLLWKLRFIFDINKKMTLLYLCVKQVHKK